MHYPVIASVFTFLCLVESLPLSLQSRDVSLLVTGYEMLAKRSTQKEIFTADTGESKLIATLPKDMMKHTIQITRLESDCCAEFQTQMKEYITCSKLRLHSLHRD